MARSICFPGSGERRHLIPAYGESLTIALVREFAMRTFTAARYCVKPGVQQILDQFPDFPRDDYARLNFGDCPMNATGFSNTTRWMPASFQPRLRISSIVLGTASGSLMPQSQAEFIQMRSA